MSKRILKRGIVSTIAAAVGLALALDASAILAPGRADTYVSSTPSEEQKNFGAERTMKVSPTAFSLVRFNLSNTTPTWVCSEEVDKATIMLWVKTLDNPGSVDVHLVTSDWNEMDVTWS